MDKDGLDRLAVNLALLVRLSMRITPSASRWLHNGYFIEMSLGSTSVRRRDARGLVSHVSCLNLATKSHISEQSLGYQVSKLMM